MFHHPECIFETFKRVRATTKVIEDPGDLDGWEALEEKDKEPILKLIRTHAQFVSEKKTPTKTKASKNKTVAASPQKTFLNSPTKPIPTPTKIVRPPYNGDLKHKDNSFKGINTKFT